MGRDFAAPLSDPPLGSGPYRIESISNLGRSVTYARRDLTGGRATSRPDGATGEFRPRAGIEYFRDDTVALQAFKAGEIDLREEDIAKNWATAYNFPAAAERAR